MKPWSTAVRLLSTSGLVGLLITCGSGGSSSNNTTEKANFPPVTTAPTWTPVDNPLVRFRNYTFQTTATDPDIGDTVASYEWDFGDGSPTVTTTVNTVTYFFQASGDLTLKVRARDSRGLQGSYTAKVITVDSSSSPITATFVNPSAAATLSTDVGSSTQMIFMVDIQNTSGSTVSAAGILFDAGDGTRAVVGAPTQQTATTWNIPVTYSAATAIGTRTATPTLRVANAVGVSSATVTGPTITINTLGSGNTAPTTTVTNPAAASTTVAATKPFALGFTLVDAQADAVTYTVDWGDGSPATQGSTSGNTQAGVPISLQHVYSDSWVGTGKTATVTVSASDGRTNGQATPVTRAVVVTSNRPPSLLITDPASQSPTAFTSKAITLGFSISDPDGDKVNYVVDWGDGTATTSGDTGTAATDQGAGISLTHTFPDAFTATSRAATVKVDANDGRSGGTAAAVSRTFTVSFNAFPTATITTPQASGTLPSTTDLPNDLVPGLKNPPGPNDPDIVVIPNGGRLAFAGTSTLPGSQDAQLTYSWSFQNGSPSTTASVQNPGEIYFFGEAGKITPCLVEFKVTDAFGRDSSTAAGVNPKTFRKWVIVDGKHTQNFKLTFMYRQKSDNNGTSTLVPVTTTANGKGALVQIFQDGQSNTWSVADQASTKASISIPVRSDLPFYIKLPDGISGDVIGYMMRIPNAPAGPYADPTLGTSVVANESSFGFENASDPWNPTLQVVTAQGFAPETAPAAERRIQGTASIYGWQSGTDPYLGNVRWLDRLTVPFKAVDFSDPLGAIQWEQSGNSVGAFAGIRANQLFAEWPMLLRTRELAVPSSEQTSLELPAKDAKGTGFLVDYSLYASNPGTDKSTVVYVDEMQVFRIPKGSTDPYDLDTTSWASNWRRLYQGRSTSNAPLPNYLTKGPTQWSQWIYNAPGSTPLAGGINGLAVPYDKNDPDRKPSSAVQRYFTGLASTFSYSEYFWSSVWARPVVLNAARLNAIHTSQGNLGSFSRFANTQPDPLIDRGNSSATWPTLWPSATSVTPDGAAGAFDMNVVGGGTFDGSSPVVAPGSGKGVGRFYWTAYTPFYDAAGGSVISRTWLAEGTGTQQPPIAFPSATPNGDATSALGFAPPIDVVVDKRGRKADGTLSGDALGGYRVAWFNPTKDASSAPVPPDFWVIEFQVNGKKTHYMLPASYPASQQAVSDLILTDARSYLPSGSASMQANDTVAPGYCWFDVPLELRPALQDPKNTSYITVFAIKSILRNNPIASARALKRLDWVDAIKTVSATIQIKPSTGWDLAYAHKIPFNFGWDIVVANSASTPVAP